MQRQSKYQPPRSFSHWFIGRPLATADAAHETIGKIAGEICDIAIAVKPLRIPSFVDGFKSTGNGKPLVEVESFMAASAWLDQNRKTGDVVLLENDLPDLYEGRLRI